MTTAAAPPSAAETTQQTRSALRLRVRGVVQGVGFRPFVHGLAVRHALCGWVRNGSNGVEIAIEGAALALDAFVRDLRADAPPLARIDDLETESRPWVGHDTFAIVASMVASDERQPVAPDVTTCAACEQELRDPTNRRFQYPFITCTDCGPRYSVIECMPYDRERTSMRAFQQCPACRAEYATPGNRRYHSETNSCPACGPRLAFEVARAGAPAWEVRSPHPMGAQRTIAMAARFWREGLIVAVRAIGGFHLAVDATNEEAVRRLRRAKHRDAKPFAVMVRSLDEARSLAALDDVEAALLLSRERPVVLVRRNADGPLAPSIAPDLPTVGLMLPSAPLQHLLLEAAGMPLVMTSGNLSDEPIVSGVDEARERLSKIADAFLWHDREIVSRVDDSVVRAAAGRPLMLRRSRGIAPLPVALPIASPQPLLAVGAHLKNTCAFVHGNMAYVSPHIGDLGSLETLHHFRATAARLRDLFRIEPAVVAHDMHPGYLSTTEAMSMPAAVRIAVQHHHAHIAAVLAEHGDHGPAIGVAFDGTGYGDDGTVWGAEFLIADLTQYERVGHLRPAPLPGNEAAVRLPWRAATGYLSLAPELAPSFARTFETIGPNERAIALHQAERRLNAPLASSMGRLFDAAAAVLGVCGTSRYEGEAAIRLEALAARHAGARLPFPVRLSETGRWMLDPLPLLATLGERALAGDDPGMLAAAFHESVAAGTADVVDRLVASTGITVVALGGGTFQNARLLDTVRGLLQARGLRVLWPQLLPPNDGAISYGQAAVAAARLARDVASSVH